ncbi:MAG TPA: AMP-binding protein [Candidatus Limnocylindria bacterium]|nr:AMP-binding protein [Candidatus Limnocylindria bacterium]
MQNLFLAFQATAAAFDTTTGLYSADREISYHEILHESQRAAQALRAAGVHPGDRVALWLRNSPEFVYALMGILAADGVAVPVNCFLRPTEVDHVVQDSGAKIVIAELDQKADLIDAGLGDRVAILTPDSFAAIKAPIGDSLPQRGESDLAVLIYTSGTTGKPKGAMLTHGNLLHNIASCRVMLEVDSPDRFVVLLPMFHSFMLTVGILLPLLTGASLICVKGLQSPRQIVEEIITRQGTILPAMASIFRALAHLPAGLELSSLRLCISGAGPLPAEILRAFNARHPRIPLIEGYGLSEASPVVSVNPVKGPWHAGTIGIPIPGVEVSIQDEHGNHLEIGVDGEICVRGGNVMVGYWNDAAKTAEALRNGWLLTGDIGHRRPDGWFVVTDRKKDMLKPNGINVYPREIEEVIYRFQGIKEAAVVGEPCERRGERAVAFVALDEGLALDEPALQAYLKVHLADYKLPRRIIQLPSLPKNGTGKIAKPALREALAKGVS